MSTVDKKSGLIITFYSYKGGVGRSMALANIACLVADQQILMKKRTLIIDWDLEAPGLHKFFPQAFKLRKNKQKPGIIDYFSELEILLNDTPDLYREISQEDGWRFLNRAIPIEKYIIRDVYPGVDLIKAGNINAQYPEKVSAFDWVSFYKKFNLIFRTFSEVLTGRYAYSLIDSRTGFTDTSGICTMLLPEKLVVVFTPNEQSSRGAADLSRLALKYRRSSEDLRPLSIFPLPSRIDDAEEELRRRWRKDYQKAFEQVFRAGYDLKHCNLTGYFNEVKLPHRSYYSYGEKLAVLNELNESLTLHRAYKTFCNLLLEIEAPWEYEPVDEADDTPLGSGTDSTYRETTGTKVFVSSTMRDMPEHREQVMDACMRLGMYHSDMMEHLAISEKNALEISLSTIDRADIYVGIFGFRYGYVPGGKTISVAEAEYNRAKELGIPRMIFLMSDEHPVRPSDVETGRGAEKLESLKGRLKMEGLVAYFDTTIDLRAKVIQALVPYREADTTKFHHVSDVPTPPEMYVVHPYTLLQTHGLVGRQKELDLLARWVADSKSDIYKARILSVVAIGGMGKSALTWKWFNEIAPEEMKPLAGRMWWSFYESDATFENFIIRSLAYISKCSIKEIQQINPQDREAQLLSLLDREPFLIVLDGLERILVAYSRMNAAHLSDNDYDKKTAKVVANAYGLPESATQSFVGEHRLRKTADPRVGLFLRRLSNVRATRVLVSTRLHPADLQTVTGETLGNVTTMFLHGLSDEDALNLWRSHKVTGTRELLLPIFNRVENHPLLIQALAAEVSRYRQSPGNFNAWLNAHPDFDPFSLPSGQVKANILEFALRGLDVKSRGALNTIAAFRMPAQYDTLATLLIGKKTNQCKNELELDKVLNELEDRGLVGWDKRANRYDLHPIVRGVVWSGLGDDAKRGVYKLLHEHFEAVPEIEDWKNVRSLEDLTPAIELYNTLIGLGRYEEAFPVYYYRLCDAMFYRLNASRQAADLLEMLFPDGLDQSPRLSDKGDQAQSMNDLAAAYFLNGQPGRALPLFKGANAIQAQIDDNYELGVGLLNLVISFRLTGGLAQSEGAARQLLIIARDSSDRFRESECLAWLGVTLAARGMVEESRAALEKARSGFAELSNERFESVVNFNLAVRAIWAVDSPASLKSMIYTLEKNQASNYERDYIRIPRVWGEVALKLNDIKVAEERLTHALTRARAVDYVEEELPALTALAELRRRKGDEKAARGFLDDVWEYAERGPYPLFHADALNVLVQIERDAGNVESAKEAATKAYELAWCDGPPYAYHWGLVKAQKHLEELGAPLPDMPPFDESKYGPMPEVEIDPDDEFHVGKEEE